MKSLGMYILPMLMPILVISQENGEEAKAKEKALRLSTDLIWQGNKDLSENKFPDAEVAYRKAIAKSPENAVAPYNLGTAYYEQETFSEAFGRFKEAGEAASSKEEKHKAYHNMGNVFMKRKEYEKAVEAYKEALRNGPTDEETRYNLALAKEMLKKDQQNQDNKDNKDDQDNKDNKDKDQDQKNEGDNKDQENQNQDQKDKGDEGDKGDEKNDENEKGDGDEKKEQNKNPQEQKGQEQRPDQLSKQQVENLLRAMQNAEKQVQDKIDAQKVKGAKVKNEKDW